MSQAAEDEPTRFTWDDYRTWPDDARWELLGGHAFAMSPSPETRHQSVLRELGGQLFLHFRGHRCQVFFAPMDVKLSAEDVVQPDILLVCDPRQITRTHIEGPPTLAVEILSPHSLAHDRVRKTAVYARFGVKEYWIVTPHPAVVEVFLLDGQSYRLHGAYEQHQELISPSFPDLRVDLTPVFAFPLDPGEEPPVVREPPGNYRTSGAAAEGK